MDYYTHASFIVKMTDAQAERILDEHEAVLNDRVSETSLADYFDELDDTVGEAEGVHIEFNGEDELWFSNKPGTSFSNEYAVAVIQSHLAREGLTDEVVSWSYAMTASRPTLDAFGGGAVAVSAEDVNYLPSDTVQALAATKLRSHVQARGLMERAKAANGLAKDEDLRDALGLDNLVHDTFAANASDTNNRTVEDVIVTLLENGLGPEDIFQEASPSVTP